jgi:protoporphyrinogen oxidase
LKIAVIGAGLTGLTAAYRLSKNGHEVTVFEEADTPGGLAFAFQAGSELLDRFYHHMFVSDTELLELIDELSLSDRLDWYEPKNAIYLEDSLYPFTSPVDLLNFKPLRFLSRIRMGLLVLSSKFIKDYRPFEFIRAKDWIIARSGRDAYDKVWGPLLISKFDVDADSVSGTWIWNKFKLRGSSRGKNISKEQLGYIQGGFITIIDALADRIQNNGCRLLLNKSVKSISKNGDNKWEVSAENGSEIFDRILFTAAPELLANVCSGFTPEYENNLRLIRYKANLCLTLELEESLSPYYWITVAQAGLPFVLIIEHTNLVGLKGYGSHIVYLSRYLDESDPLYSSSDDEIVHTFIKGLQRVFPDFKKESIKKASLSRARYAQPVVKMGYGESIPAVKTPLDGLYLASMPQIYPEDRGLNYAVRLADHAVDEISKNM